MARNDNKYVSPIGGIMRKNKGFTLIELLVVIAIIGILAILIFLALGRAQKGARDSQRKAGCRDIATAEAMYYDTKKSYTDSFAELKKPKDNPYMAQTPSVCAQAKESLDDCIGSDNGWDDALDKDSSRGFVVTANLENGDKNFVCDKNGCKDD